MPRGESQFPPFQRVREAPDEGLATAEQPDPLIAADLESRCVLVSGAAGFIGRNLVPRLASRGHTVRALCHSSESLGTAGPAIEWRCCDVTVPESLEDVADGCDSVIHLAGIPKGRGTRTLERVHATGTRNLIRESARHGVRRFVLVSAIGSSPTAGAFFRSKFQAEDAVMTSGLDYVVLRPSVIYGPDDHFTSALVRLLEALPAFPILGDGGFPLQPVAVEDIADALCQCVEREDVRNRTFELAGPDTLTFVKIVRIVGRTIGVRRTVMRLPAALAAPAARTAAALGLPLPFPPDQLEVLRWGSVSSTDENALQQFFRLKPLPFRAGIADYLGDV